MRIAEFLAAVAGWLESPENEALMLAEYDEACLTKAAEVCVQAATILRQGAQELDQLEPQTESVLTTENLDQLNTMTTALDMSGDADLKKAASMIDELLLTIAAPPDWAKKFRQKQDGKLDSIKNNYEATREQLHEVNHLAEAEKAIEKSPLSKTFRIMEAPLQTRYCPDHAGSPMIRKDSEGTWQCSLDGKSYNFALGYTTEKGEKVPGGSVALQGPADEMDHAHAIFNTREERLHGYNK
jgi:hypothetical protein